MNIFSLLPREHQHRPSFSTPQTHVIVHLGLIPYALCRHSSPLRTFQLTDVRRRGGVLRTKWSPARHRPRGSPSSRWGRGPAATGQVSARPPGQEGWGEGAHGESQRGGSSAGACRVGDLGKDFMGLKQHFCCCRFVLNSPSLRVELGLPFLTSFPTKKKTKRKATSCWPRVSQSSASLLKTARLESRFGCALYPGTAQMLQLSRAGNAGHRFALFRWRKGE